MHMKTLITKSVFLFPPQEMTSEEKSKITDLNKCEFNEMADYFKAQSEARKQMSKEEKLVSQIINFSHTFFKCLQS